MSDDDKQLFENLAIEHMDSLYSRAIRLAKSAEVAEGLVQQTYASAFSAFEQFDKNNDFNKWLEEILMLIYTSAGTYFQESAGNC